MSKSITRTVLALPQTAYSTVASDRTVYNSGPLDVGDLVELAINVVFDAFGGSAEIFAIDANGLLYNLDNSYPGHGPLSVGAGFNDDGSSASYQARSATAFGDSVLVKVFPGSGSATTFSLSIKGK
jgi:hypothetical protein